MESLPPHGSPGAARALLVMRDALEARRLAGALRGQGLEVVQVSDDAAGYNTLDTGQVDVLICETRTQRIDGLRLLRVARSRNSDVCAILVATHAEIEAATRAMDEGAHDFQTRPLNHQKILAVVRRGIATQRLMSEMHEMARRLDRRYGFGNLIGNSAPIARVYGRILQACGSDLPVLITGEPGTGRGLVASAIHHNSPRRPGPLIRFDCGGTEAGILERELFGQEVDRGEPSRPGRIELSRRGSLLLDGIEELPSGVQGRLLRLLKDGEFERCGGRRTRRADIRVLAIAAADLRERARDGRFRSDLHDFLRAATIELPPLRNRRRDIPLLVDHFLTEATREMGRQPARITPAALDRMVRYPWPGNVGELKSVIRGMILLAGGERSLDLVDLPQEIREGIAPGSEELRLPAGSSLEEIERQVIEQTLARIGGNRERTAEALGISLRTLQRRLASYKTKWRHSS